MVSRIAGRKQITRRSLVGGSASLLASGMSGSGLEVDARGWLKYEKNPILRMGGAGAFDSQNIFAPAVIKEKGQYYLFYSGGPYGPENGHELIKYQLGLALSADGRNFTKTGKPLLPLGDRDNFHNTPTLLRNPDGSLHRSGGLWHMVFCGNRARDIEHATSSDGLTWNKENRTPLYRGAYAPNLIQSGSQIRMYYIAEAGPNQPWAVNLASGPSLYKLVAHEGNPILTLSQSWERGALFYPYVIREGEMWVMFYASYWKEAPGQGYTAIGIATSRDGIRWNKFDGNPVLTPTPGSSYDSRYCSSEAILWDGDHYKIYYASRIDMIHKYYAIGLATKRGRLFR